MRFVQAYRRLFSHAEVFTDFVREFAEIYWSDGMDESSVSLLKIPESSTFGDGSDTLLWRLAKDGAKNRPIRLLLQFRDDDDYATAIIVAARVSKLLDLQTGRDSTQQMEAVMAVVPYSGPTRWTAATDLRQLIDQELPWALYKMQPSVPFRVVEERFVPMLDRPDDNLAVGLFRAQRRQSVEGLLEDLDSLSRTIRRRKSACPELNHALANWLKVVVLARRAPGIDLSGADSIEALSDAVRDGLVPRLEAARAQAMKRSLRDSQVRGMKRAIGIVSRRRFGDRVGATLASLLSDVNSVEALRGIAGLVSSSPSAKELLDSVPKAWRSGLTPDDLLDGKVH